MKRLPTHFEIWARTACLVFAATVFARAGVAGEEALEMVSVVPCGGYDQALSHHDTSREQPRLMLEVLQAGRVRSLIEERPVQSEAEVHCAEVTPLVAQGVYHAENRRKRYAVELP